MDTFTQKKDFLEKHIKLQKELILDDVSKTLDGKAMFAFSKMDNSKVNNLVLVNEPLSDKEILFLEKKCKDANREASIYFINEKRFEKFVTLLKKYGYKKDYVDVCMYFAKKSLKVVEYKDNRFIKVSSREELDTFIETFKKCYQDNDPQNPYGNLGTKSYIASINNSWNKSNKKKNVTFYVIYKKRKPVAVSELISWNGFGYILNVGSLKEVRGEGFGKYATLCAVKDSLTNGNIYHYLMTEKDGYPSHFYTKIGFKKKFSCICYSKM